MISFQQQLIVILLTLISMSPNLIIFNQVILFA